MLTNENEELKKLKVNQKEEKVDTEKINEMKKAIEELR